MQKYNLSEDDWLQLDSNATILAKNIAAKLPVDCKLSISEIKSTIYDAYIYLLEKFDSTKNNNLMAYIRMYVRKITYSMIIKEYKWLKNQETLDDIFGEDFDDKKPCKHQYGKTEVKRLAVDNRKNIENKILVNDILEKMPKLDRLIAEMIMAGNSYQQVADIIGIDKKTVMRRLEKYKKKEEE